MKEAGGKTEAVAAGGSRSRVERGLLSAPLFVEKLALDYSWPIGAELVRAL